MFRNIIVLLLLALSMEAFAQRNGELEFAGIPFGASRETVIEEVMKMGYEPFGQMGKGERVVLPMFNFGELPVQVSFIFNANDKSFKVKDPKFFSELWPRRLMVRPRPFQGRYTGSSPVGVNFYC